MRSLRFILKRRERLVRARKLRHLTRTARPWGERWDANVCHDWTHRDDCAARNQGWCVTRKDTSSPWFIHFIFGYGRTNFERGINEDRRLATKALRAVVIAALCQGG
jgi:hypothetical protein